MWRCSKFHSSTHKSWYFMHHNFQIQLVGNRDYNVVLSGSLSFFLSRHGSNVIYHGQDIIMRPIPLWSWHNNFQIYWVGVLCIVIFRSSCLAMEIITWFYFANLSFYHLLRCNSMIFLSIGHNNTGRFPIDVWWLIAPLEITNTRCLGMER